MRPRQRRKSLFVLELDPANRGAEYAKSGWSAAKKLRGGTRQCETAGAAYEEETRLKLLAELNDVDLHERLQAQPLPGRPRGDP